MKASSNGGSYFVGEIADKTGTLRVVGFNEHQQKALAEYEGKVQAMFVDNCEIKPSRGSGKVMELIIKQSSTVDVSPKQIARGCGSSTCSSLQVSIADIESTDDYCSVSLAAKVHVQKL